MVSFHQMNLTEDDSAPEIGRKILDIGQRVALRDARELKVGLSPQGRRFPGSVFGTMSRGEPQVLEDGGIIPSCSV